MKTSIKCSLKPPLAFRVVLEQGDGRGTQEGHRSSALFSKLYLYENEGVVREKCQGIGTLPQLVPLWMLLHSSGFSKYLWFLSLVFYLV